LIAYRALVESLVLPIQEHVESWKKTVVQLDKDHARGMCSISGAKNCQVQTFVKLMALVISTDPFLIFFACRMQLLHTY
jgi:hypothetical protein